ncbi:MAG: C40 family peptidase [Gammaproteobacteria bacterium]
MLVLVGLLGGCSTPVTYYEHSAAAQKPARLHKEVVDVAKAMLGIPYHYGGDTPRQGFDCSGLVYYAHLRAGVRLPRTSYGQFRVSRPVALRNLHPGDLVFFSTRRDRVSHVGIYIGRHEFIHAPARGQDVTIDKLSEPYWHRHFVRGGRIL